MCRGEQEIGRGRRFITSPLNKPLICLSIGVDDLVVYHTQECERIFAIRGSIAKGETKPT